MPKLASLEAIETVADPRHRAILLAIRDTNLTLPKVADKLGIPYSTVHSIANLYLKSDFLRKRRLSCKSASTPGGQDTKTFVPAPTQNPDQPLKIKPMVSRSKSEQLIIGFVSTTTDKLIMRRVPSVGLIGVRFIADAILQSLHFPVLGGGLCHKFFLR